MVSLADILNARILVVDDQEANVRLLEGMLRIAGYASIESTMDPTEVCELHRRNRYSLTFPFSTASFPVIVGMLTLLSVP